MKKHCFLFILSIICSSAFSQETKNLTDHPGQLHFEYFAPVGDIQYKYSKEEDLKIKTKHEAIVKYIQSNKIFSNPIGIEIYVTGQLVDKFKTFSWLSSIPSEIYISIHPWYTDGVKIYNKCIGCGPSYFSMFINTPHYLYNGQASPAGPDIFDTDGSLINLEPNLLLEKNGVRFYDNNTIVIGKPGVPLYIPITVRQYDNLLLKHLEKMMKEQPEEMMTHKFFYDKIKEEMTQFSDADLDKPAWQYAFGGSPEPMGEGVKHIVKINKDYFDLSKPRSNTQLIVIVQSGMQSDPDKLFTTDESSPIQTTKMMEAMNSFNFEGLIKLLD